MSQDAKGKSKARDPPPTLFLHPSPSVSHVSLPGMIGAAPGVPTTTTTTQQHVAPSGQHPPSAVTSALGRGGPLLRGSAGGDAPASLASPVDPRRSVTLQGINTPGGAPSLNLNIPLQLRRGESTRTTDRTDALWAEMQATLEEVELSASGGTRVFGPDHERKLADLRMAQIALAQAWARSEADDAIETVSTRQGGSVRNQKSSVAGADAVNDGPLGKSEA